MNKSYSRRPSLRFTKWSRKSYAAFKSIGRHVTIGSLKSIVTDSFLGKQKNILSVFISAWKNNNKDQANEWDRPPDEELLLELSYAPVLQSKKIYCGFVNPQYSINNYLWLKSFVQKGFSFFIFTVSMLSYRAKCNGAEVSHKNSPTFLRSKMTKNF